MPGYVRTASLVGAALLGAALWMMQDGDRAGLHVSGDGAGPVLRWLAAKGVEQAPAETARVEAVLLRRWQNLDALPALGALCGGACGGTDAVVALRQPTPRGLRRVLLVELSGLPAAGALDAGEPIPEETVACLGRAVAGRDADCLPPPRIVWRMPF
ncbi:hypothetical protein [uncultured Jannaschia sp.]|uniref:hypothetical protein n=1 Tax=uncultured Jannaschia sp. TaxID=293347 RepID=UPI0026039AAB|nr:hypothetical protein [uncultured Jannaschia sp.]